MLSNNKGKHFNTLESCQQPTLQYSTSSDPIRLFFDPAGLISPTDEGLCRKVGDTYIDRSLSVQGTCGTDETMTDAKIKFLRETILPQALAFYTTALRVQPVQGNLTLATGYRIN